MYVLGLRLSADGGGAPGCLEAESSGRAGRAGEWKESGGAVVAHKSTARHDARRAQRVLLLLLFRSYSGSQVALAVMVCGCAAVVLRVGV